MCVFNRFTKLKGAEKAKHLIQKTNILFYSSCAKLLFFFSKPSLQVLVMMLEKGQKHRTECSSLKKDMFIQVKV